MVNCSGKVLQIWVRTTWTSYKRDKKMVKDRDMWQQSQPANSATSTK